MNSDPEKNDEHEDDEEPTTAHYSMEEVQKILASLGKKEATVLPDVDAIARKEAEDVSSNGSVATAPDSYHIVVISSKGVKPFEWPADAESIYVGRDEHKCQICLDDYRVSRVHLQIKRNEAGQIEIIDLGSTNKTFMKEGALEPHSPVVWEVGEIAAIGTTRLILKHGQP